MTLLLSTLIATGAVLAVLSVVGLIVLTTSHETLLAVARAAARNVSASFWTGVTIQLAAVPVLLLLALGLTLTIIGILLIPVLLVAWVLAATGIVTLGLLGVALMIGRALIGQRGRNDREAALYGLLLGLLLLSVTWVGAAFAKPIPIIGVATHLMVTSFTWAVTTVGIGAVVRSRASTLRFAWTHSGTTFGSWTRVHHSEVPISETPPLWATPTPLPGAVATVRRTEETSA